MHSLPASSATRSPAVRTTDPSSSGSEPGVRNNQSEESDGPAVKSGNSVRLISAPAMPAPAPRNSAASTTITGSSEVRGGAAVEIARHGKPAPPGAAVRFELWDAHASRLVSLI